MKLKENKMSNVACAGKGKLVTSIGGIKFPSSLCPNLRNRVSYLI
uniref:Uncharacterized protein n=1 Tax=Anguilla anguilla TaxID=7936 RepID=A0A0E9WAP7_ANGAN